MKELTRQAFYDLVWSKPMTELAKGFGVSDVALHKKCKKYQIPTPDRGYWAKVAAGHSVSKTPLQDVSGYLRNSIRIFPSPILSLSPEIKAIRAKSQEQKNKLKKNPMVLSLPNDLPACIEHMRRKLEASQMQNKECMVVNEEKLFSIAVSPTNTTRLLIILNELVKETEAMGHKVEAGDKGLQFNVDGEAITLHIWEKTDKLPHEPTEKEALALQKWEAECTLKRKRKEWIHEWDKPKVPEFDRPYNGQLVIEIDKNPYHYDHIRRKFSDGKHNKLESILSEVVAGVEMCAAAIKAKRAKKEQDEVERQERARLAEIRRRQENLEAKRAKNLEENISRWRKTAEIRAFADAVEKRFQAENLDDPEIKTKIGEWLDWTRSYANQIDPILNSVPALIHEKDCNSWELDVGRYTA